MTYDTCPAPTTLDLNPKYLYALNRYFFLVLHGKFIDLSDLVIVAETDTEADGSITGLWRP